MEKCTLTIDLSKSIAKTDDRLFSSFIEHMGRAIYTGIYEPGHVTADEKGFRNDVKDLIRPLKLSHIRYPGGNFLSGYQWEDGIGPKESRPVRPDLAWFALEPNQVGTDEFLTWCEEMNVEPMMGVNLGTGTPLYAKNLLEYCNSDLPTEYANKRRANGHEKPYNVKLWCLGNEMDGPWQICGKTAEEYGRIAHETAKMMKWLDPSIELVACGSSHKNMPTFGEWERTVLRHLWNEVDYLSLHQYYRNDDGDIQSFLARNLEMNEFIEEVAAICDEIAKEKHSDKKVYLSFDEWNVWYHWQNNKCTSPEWIVGRPLEEEAYDISDALVVGCMINTLLNHADVVKIACLAQLVNALAAINTEANGNAWAQTIYWPFKYASNFGRGTVLNTVINCPTYSCAINNNVPFLDSSTVLSEDGKYLTVFVVNRNLSENATLEIEIPGAKSSSHFAFYGSDLYASNNAKNSSLKPVEMNAPSINQNTVSVILPPASWNMIRISL